MPKRLPKFPRFRQVAPLELVVPNSDQLADIKKAYGQLPPVNALFKLAIARGYFLQFAQIEREAIAKKEFVGRLEDFAVEAKALRNELDPQPRTSDMLRDVYLDSSKPVGVLQGLIDTLDGLISGIERFCTTTVDPQFPSFIEGEAWNLWIYHVTIIMKEHGLPYGARKDAAERKAGRRESRFVLLVYELQKLLPVEPRRHDQKLNSLDEPLDSLAQAINRARKGNDLNRKFFDAFDMSNHPAWAEWAELRKKYE